MGKRLDLETVIRQLHSSDLPASNIALGQ
jgi:hypothetical protein